jgi:hypothetical protein
MTSTLPDGTLFVAHQKGRNRIWKLNTLPDGRRCYGGVGRPVQVGEVVHRCVWKGEDLQSRGTYTVHPGDVSWVTTGHHSLIAPYAEVFRNEFGPTVPSWLRGA